jgi:hypothetical protein
MGKEVTHQIRQNRPDGFYITDNELVDQLASEIGIFAFGVYHLLKRLTISANPSIGLRGIAEKLGISVDSAKNAIDTLKRFGLVSAEPGKRPNDPPIYVITHAKDAVADNAQNPQDSQSRTEFRTRAKRVRVRNSAQGAYGIPYEGVRNSAQGRTEFRTPNKEEDLKTKTKKDIPTPTPPCGVASLSVEAVDEKPAPSTAPALRRAAIELPGLSRYRAAFDGVLKELHIALIGAALAFGTKGHPNLRDGGSEWDQYFASVSLEDFESAEGRENDVRLVLGSDDPAMSARGFTIYRRRIEGLMQKYFGKVVQVRWQGKDEAAA